MRSLSSLVIRCVVATFCIGVVGSMTAPALQAQSAGPQGSWSAKAALPVKLSEVAVASVGGKIYVLGGSTPDVVDLPLNQEYDPATDRWRERAPLPRGLTHAGAAGLNGKIYVVGAFTAAGHGGATDSVFE